MIFSYFAVLSLLANLPCQVISREQDDIAMNSRHLKPKKANSSSSSSSSSSGKKAKSGKETKAKKGKKGKKSISPFPTVAPTIDLIRAALLAFYDSTNGSDWTGNSGTVEHNWGSLETTPDFDVCTLDGVTCTNGEITELILEGFGLTGEIPSEIGLLTSLTFLGLNVNALMGQIPAEIGLTSLTALNLNSNALTGTIPSEFGNLSFAEECSVAEECDLGFACLINEQANGFVYEDLDPSTNCLLIDLLA